MSLTVLFDLDDTLLSNNVEVFIPGYLKELGKTLGELSSKQIIPQLLVATQKMSEADLPEKSLEQTFDENFYPNVGMSKEQMRGTIDHFYQDVFPKLKVLTHPIPEAVRLVDRLFSEGYNVAIATRPLFPRTAILQRLEWAGLPVEKYPFAIVPCYETFHFSKPNPAFYAELLAQIGWPEQPAVMVGNTFEDDILPAGQFNLPAFWLNDPPISLPVNAHPYTGQGKMDEVYNWIKKIEAADFKQSWTSPESFLAILKSTPAALDTLSRKIPSSKWTHRPQSGGKSITEILCYLRDLDREIITPRLYRIIEENNPFIPKVDLPRWIEGRNYLEESGCNALEDFTNNRIELINFVQSLPAEARRRPAVLEENGPTNFDKMLELLTAHDREQIRIMVEAINSLQ
ncbi:MAG: HAD family hydrolase [Anaerolineaceae bacterium]|nr:HAD family hydrolase [Anaerolineaceae bacterium]